MTPPTRCSNCGRPIVVVAGVERCCNANCVDGHESAAPTLLDTLTTEETTP